MKKSILNLEGAHEISKNEQKTINGGKKRACSGGLSFCNTQNLCDDPNAICINGCCEMTLNP